MKKEIKQKYNRNQFVIKRNKLWIIAQTLGDRYIVRSDDEERFVDDKWIDKGKFLTSQMILDKFKL